MLITDPIADMLTRIRNALTAKHEDVLVPASTVKKAIAEILLGEGYIKSYDIREDGVAKYIHIDLKYGPNKQRVITGLKRISKPGLRIYARKDQLPKVLNGLGIAIISTSRGIMTDREARKQGVGGEVLAYIW
ncbi:MAG: 30S ribosomal protein S8 [Eubacteriales bacterium]|nr:30S ribosomal protein S8 [Eubacteriales bacterium]MCI6943424.1 30S ribosomal protein S8 [Christensenellaceae bacterium]MDY4695361.1 30S ribosomal protein S8 [Eubacteriales bacterium]